MNTSIIHLSVYQLLVLFYVGAISSFVISVLEILALVLMGLITAVRFPSVTLIAGIVFAWWWKGLLDV